MQSLQEANKQLAEEVTASKRVISRIEKETLRVKERQSRMEQSEASQRELLLGYAFRQDNSSIKLERL